MTDCTVTIAGPESWSVESEHVAGHKCIGTHNGTFHCDEALACGILKSLPQWRDAVVVRTRDPDQLAKCDIVVDVGGVYDAEALLFDHHQRTFTDTMAELGFKTRLSSAGLVYRHFGLAFLKECLKGAVPDEVVEKVLYKKVYKNFIEEVDGVDNGVNAFDGAPNYTVTSALGARVSRLNPDWNGDASPGAANANFKSAMALTLCELAAHVRALAEAWWPARSIIAASLSKAADVYATGEVVILDEFCPWKEHLHDLEREAGIFGRTKFVLYGDSGGGWRVQTVPLAATGFENRMPIEPAWWGVRDDKLSDATGIPGCVFVHANGFIGGNKSREGALAMALKSLELAEARKSASAGVAT
ncbi:metal-dependent protein hydrolase [Tribonema minus]|uniref:Metal-dependent protein hydrolase n=1 Tax=Tribonema minus TaxID=303371 RepID=A0A835YTP6_9STRA|nr:metal-dependent protein hydrolase [Tribonema minus]